MSVAVIVRRNGRTAVAVNTGATFGGMDLTPELADCSYLHTFGDAVVTSVGWGVYHTLLEEFRADGGWHEPHDTVGVARFFRSFRAWMDDLNIARKAGGRDDQSPFGDFDSDFLLGTPTGAFVVPGQGSVIPITRFFAIGSGGELAMGAMHTLYDSATSAEDLARRAVRTANELSESCSGGIAACVAGEGEVLVEP